jgi:hypothetical protein
MAVVSLRELRDALRSSRDWEACGFESPDKVVAIELEKEGGGSAVFEPSLVRRTITYEAREATLVLDFDDKGYLVSMEIV